MAKRKFTRQNVYKEIQQRIDSAKYLLDELPLNESLRKAYEAKVEGWEQILSDLRELVD